MQLQASQDLVTITPALITHHFQMDQQAMEILKRCEEVGNHHYEVIWLDIIFHTVGKWYSILTYIYTYIYIFKCMFFQHTLGLARKPRNLPQGLSKKNNNNLSRNATDSLCGWWMLRVCFFYWSYFIHLIPSKRSSIWWVWVALVSGIYPDFVFF